MYTYISSCKALVAAWTETLLDWAEIHNNINNTNKHTNDNNNNTNYNDNDTTTTNNNNNDNHNNHNSLAPPAAAAVAVPDGSRRGALKIPLVGSHACHILHPSEIDGGCVWLFYRLGRETSISQNWLKGYNMASMICYVIRCPRRASCPRRGICY